jgi:hypothetical protein
MDRAVVFGFMAAKNDVQGVRITLYVYFRGGNSELGCVLEQKHLANNIAIVPEDKAEDKDKTRQGSGQVDLKCYTKSSPSKLYTTS